MRTRGRIWAGTLLLAVLSQFAGPLSGVASAFVGPVWLPVSQEQPAEAALDGPMPAQPAAESTECQDEASEQTEAMSGASGLGLFFRPILVSQPCEPASDAAPETEQGTVEEESVPQEPSPEPEPAADPVGVPGTLVPAAPAAVAAEPTCPGTGTPQDAPNCVADLAGCLTTADAVPAACAAAAQNGLLMIVEKALGCDPGVPAECAPPPPCTPGDAGCVLETVTGDCSDEAPSPGPLCGVSAEVQACAESVDTKPGVCGGALEAAVFNVLCAEEEDCPAPVRSLRSCIDWREAGPTPDAACVLTAVVDGVCSGQEPCLLRHPAVEALLAAPDACGDAETCTEGLQDIAVAALCASETDCLSEKLAEEIDGCTPDDIACQALALLHEVCRRADAACTPEVEGLEPCLTRLGSMKCGDGPDAVDGYQPYFQRWIAAACVLRASASPACPVGVAVALPRTAPTADGGTQNLPPDFENGSTIFPYRSIKRGFDALRGGVGGAVAGFHVGGISSLKGPVSVSAGTYTESFTLPSNFPEDAVVSIVGTGVASLAGTLTLPPNHRLAIQWPLKITGTPAIEGPKATTTVTVDRTRMYVGHGAGVDLTYGNAVGVKLEDVVNIPEQVSYQLSFEGPGVSKQGLQVQKWNGAAWGDVAYDPDEAVPTVEVFSSAANMAVPAFSGSTSIRLVASSTMGLTITGQLVGVMTEVVYATATTPYIEVAEVPDAPVPPVATPRTEADDAPPTVRLSGEDRAATAAAVSRSAFPDGADAVFVATGASYADALAGGPAAAKSGSPVVLVERDRVPEATRAELARLAPEQVRLLGGTGAISAEVEEELAATGADVSRLRGDSRYATAAAVSAAHFAPGVPVVYIASGEGFADALSGGAAAAALGGPVLLVQPDTVPSATEQELQRLSPGRIVVLGGKQAVSDTVEAQLRASGAEVRRVSGATRYATSAAVSRDAFSGAQDTVFVATGATFPDALAGVPAAGALKAPLMLVETDRLPVEVAAELDRLRPKRIVVLGGQSSVSQRLERELRSYQIP